MALSLLILHQPIQTKHMKTLIIFIIPFLSLSLRAQDTSNLFVNYDGTMSFTVLTKKDTLHIWMYPNGKKESEFRCSGGESSGVYTRWHDNGKLMWVKNIVNSKENGLANYYNNKGVKVGSFNYSNGVISDTFFLKSGTHIVFGKITSSSKVYGGAVREDGSSDISEYIGPSAHCAMYAALVDSLKKPVLVSRFKTDYMGHFFLVVPPGLISFFPEELKIETIQPCQFFIPPSAGGSSFSAWKESAPLRIEKNTALYHVELQHSSVGYAP